MSKPSLPKRSPQSQSDVAELHRHDFPRQRHPKRRTPYHRTTTDRIIERMRVIDQPGIGSKLGDSDDKSEKKKSREQRVAPDERETNEQTVIDNVERCSRAPVRPRRKR